MRSPSSWTLVKPSDLPIPGGTEVLGTQTQILRHQPGVLSQEHSVVSSPLL